MVFEKMKEHLGAIGLYAENAAVSDTELRIYAAEMERLYDALRTAIGERFIATAQDEGLRVYEELFGPPRDDLSTARRRELLTLRLNLGEGDFTPAGIRKALDSFGLSYTISEYPLYSRLNIIAQTDYTKAEQAFIRQEVYKILPAHLLVQMVFNTLTWSELDAMNKRFSTIDAENLTWEQIDALEHE